MYNDRRGGVVDINVGDVVKLKKKHPCGCDVFKITRIGMDFKIKCEQCGREVMIPRKSAEKSIKKIIEINGEKDV